MPPQVTFPGFAWAPRLNTGDFAARDRGASRRLLYHWGRWNLCTLCATISFGCAARRVHVEPVYFPPSPEPSHAVHLVSGNRLDELVPAKPSVLNLFRPARPLAWVARPAGLAYHNGCLYICDPELGAVHEWNLETRAARMIGDRGDSTLVEPVAVAVDEAGNIFVADTERAAVLNFDRSGNATGRIRPPDERPFRPTALATDRGTLYACDIASHCLHAFAVEPGGVEDRICGSRFPDGAFYFPMGVAIGHGLGLLVSDMLNSRVHVLAGDESTPDRSFGRPGNRYGDMGKPRHLAVGPDGVVFVADAEFGYIHLFSTSGHLLMLLGGPEDQAGGTPLPVGLAVASPLPDSLRPLVPPGFRADYALIVANSAGTRRISVYAIGLSK